MPPRFIPEWGKISGAFLHLKRLLNALDDEYIVRRPIRPDPTAPDLLVQHPQRGWLALNVAERSLAGQGRADVERRLADLHQLDNVPPEVNRSVAKRMLVWGCSREEASRLYGEAGARAGVPIVSREDLTHDGIGALLGDPGLPAPDRERQTTALLARYFPEAEIPAVCTTRSFFRNNRSQLDRYFMDGEQEWAAKLDLAPPAEQAAEARDLSVRLINGVAGSGKTIIALSRARLLAERFPNDPVLVLIHNAPIVADVRDRLRRAQRGLPRGLEILTFYGWARRQWKTVFRAEPDAAAAWQVIEVIEKERSRWPALRMSSDQLLSELDFLNEALLHDEEEYLVASRTGRGFALRSGERSMIWALAGAVADSLHEQGKCLWSAIPRDLCLAAEGGKVWKKVRHIIIDEGQFFAPSWFQLVKLGLQADGHLFICADPNQGFLKSRLSWRSVGLEMAGRTRRLRHSYRSTQAILQAGAAVLAQHAAEESDEYLRPDYSTMEPGRPPLLIYTDAPQDSVDRVANEVISLRERIKLPLAAMLLVYGDKVPRKALYDQLTSRLPAGSVWWLNHGDQRKRPPSGGGAEHLRMAYVDTATGLEGAVVFLLGVENLFSADAPDGQQHDGDPGEREANARKLYMAMTRAGSRLILVSWRRLPPSIERLFEVTDRPAAGAWPP
jgi:hypothetical protein